MVYKRVGVLLSVVLASSTLLLAPVQTFAMIKTLNGQNQPDQTFQNDTNVTISSSAGVHSLGWQGLLGISRGGTNASSFTNGSIFFFNGTSFAQNNSNFFWDNANNRLGIGTNSPTNTLSVNGNGNVTGNLSVTGTISASNFNPSSYVPYTGATGGVDLGSNSLTVGGNIINSSLKPSASSDEALNFTTHTLTLGVSINGTGYIRGVNSPDNGGQGGGALAIVGGAGNNSYRGGDVGLEGGGGRTPDSAGGSVYLKGGEGGPNGNSDGGDVVFYTGFKYGSGAWGRFKFLSYGQTATYGILDFTNLTGSDKTFSFPDTSGTVGIREADQTWSGLNKFEGSSNSTIYVGSATSPGCIVMGDTSGGAVTYVTANAGVLSASTTKPSTCQ